MNHVTIPNFNKLSNTRWHQIPQEYALPQSKTFAEFFAGIGLVRLGLEKEGWTVAFANDIDEQKKEMYDDHFVDLENHFLLKDVHHVRPKSVPTVVLATASFPCNDLSLAGARMGLSGEQSSAFWGFIRILKALKERRPPLVLIENVPGFLTSHAGKDFKMALTALNRLGYAVDPFMIDAARFVPQSRQRLFVVGRRKLSQEGNQLHNEISAESELRPPALATFISRNSSIDWAIRDLPPPRKNRKSLEDLLEPLPESAPEWWDTERTDYLVNQMSPRHRKIADKMISGRDWTYGTVFRRVRNGKSMAELRVDGTAGCLRTPRGGSGRQILFKAGKGRYRARLLTPRECARLMGADNYRIDEATTPNQALFGFGDAVCVPVIRWIAKNYLNPLVEELGAHLQNSNGKKHSAVA